MVAPGPTEFSVIVSTRNRPAQLKSCLEALRALSFPGEDFEVIVVDDGGDLSLDRICEPFRQRLDLLSLRQERNGPGPARNRGAAAARGRFLAFIDDDCRPDPNWLRAFHLHLTNRPDELIGGKVVNALTANVFSATAQVILDSVYAYYNPVPDRAHFFASSNLAVSREKFRQIGGFPEPWPVPAAEDRTFCYAWRQRGWRLSYAPEAVVEHRHKLDLLSFWRLYVRYGRGAFLYHRIRDRDDDFGGINPDAAFYRECLRRGTDNRSILETAKTLSLLATWQVANAAGYLMERCNFSRKPTTHELAGRACSNRTEHSVHAN